MPRLKGIIHRLSEKYGREYFERWHLRRRASIEHKEPLLTVRPIEDDEATDSNTTIRRRSLPEVLPSIPVVGHPPLATFGPVPVRVRNSKQRSSDSQDTMVASTYRRPTTSHGEHSRQPSVGRFTFESAETASDDVTPTPGLENSSDCRFSIATTADANLDSQKHPLTCYICGKFFGPREPRTKEVVAYLPCGHGVGHDCLFNWMTAPNGSRRCPAMPCISIRHQCEHITSPETEEPSMKFGSTAEEREATVLPWDYGFCSGSKGTKLHASIKVTILKIRKLEAKQARGGKTVALNQRLAMHRSVVERHERKLDELQKKWWTAQWKQFEQKKEPRPRARQIVKGGDNGETFSTRA